MVSWKVPPKYYFDKLVKSQNNFYLLLMSKLLAISYIIKYLFVFMSLFKHIDIEKKILCFFQNPYVSQNFSSDTNDLLIEMFLMLT